MVKQEADRLESPSEQPFTYQQPADSGYTLQSVSTVTTVRPLSSPHITPRRSSLVAPETHSPSHPAEPVFVVPDDMVMPHEPPPRRSSLDLSAPAKEDLPLVHADAQSLLSSSITNTDTSAFSPSTSSQEHPLSSATTSLSRSAKSGQEGSDEKHAALSAIRLQRSLEWEAKQTRRRRRLERRKMAVLELVETEVAYTEDLRTLVQIYLPQLAAMPSISDRTVALVSRNAAELLEFHAQLATQMVDVLKVEQITFAVQHGVDSQIERASRKLAALLVDNVSSQSYAQIAHTELMTGLHVRKLPTILRRFHRSRDVGSTHHRSSRLRLVRATLSDHIGFTGVRDTSGFASGQCRSSRTFESFSLALPRLPHHAYPACLSISAPPQSAGQYRSHAKH